jgi:hypothetical protein
MTNLNKVGNKKQKQVKNQAVYFDSFTIIAIRIEIPSRKCNKIIDVNIALYESQS